MSSFAYNPFTDSLDYKGSSGGGGITASITTEEDLFVTSNMYYIGVTDTSTPRTIFLPDGSAGITAGKDQVFVIKDESFSAGTNAITVTTQGGTVLIDNATSQLINTNGGHMTVVYRDGTNYFII